MFFKKAGIVFAHFILLALCLSEGAQAATRIGRLKDFYSRPDTLQINRDSLQADSLQLHATDSIQKKNTRKDMLEDPVDYSSTDSMAITLGETRKLFLWGNAKVLYQDIDLEAAYIEFDMDRKTVFAQGTKDSTGKDIGLPVFKQNNDSYTSHKLTYNFETKKGYIEAVKTEQEGGYLHGEEVKRLPSGEINIRGGKYTTCDADHPHFYLALTKAISIPGDKIVAGPAYMVLEDVPLPMIGIPFGFFPSTKTSTSGVMIPTYGEERTRGFYLRNGGYYFPINDHVDLRINGDIYSKGTWGLSTTTNYKKRYAFSGNFSGRYYNNVSGEKDLPDYSKSRDFSIQWSHRQDPKANPTRTLSANVNFSSSSFDRNHSYNIENYLTNRKSSSISYTKVWPNSPFNFTAGLTHSQNSNDNSVDMGLPSMSLNMGSVYPLRNLGKSGKERFWQNLQLSYSSSLQNNVFTTDSALFTRNMFDHMSNGYRQSIPLSLNLKPFNGLNIAPSVNYNAVLYTSHIEKYWDPLLDLNKNDTIVGGIVTDTIHGLSYAHSYFPAMTVTLNPKIYGMFTFKKGSVKAIRHVITPSASFSYVPDVTGILPEYYRTVYDSVNKREIEYSIYEGYMHGTPTINGRSGNVNLSLRNVLEMKVKSEKDTSDKEKKVKLLDNFDFSTSYNVFAEQFNWSNIRFNTGTSFFDRLVDIRFSAGIDPYQLDSVGKRINVLELSNFAKTHRIGRFSNAQLNIGMQLKSATKKEGAGTSATTSSSPREEDPSMMSSPDDEFEDYSGEYVDFSIPWSARIDYSWSYSKPAAKASIIQTVRLSGDFSLTPKWKIGYNTGYDFVNHKMSLTSINIYRDLHCWEMRLTLVPFGERKNYNFTINVKSSMLKDLKYNKRKSWYDNL